ncbi:hypothetical protein BGZ61DRAFT_478192 [Ilyonectria robusta]|uniref:uncharacterized protein n=1 Tax=Ilyonectria robusta TaxID=1079257 RepID=UPI001E8CB4E7|nr:uncharacterized protein BGZ61DRAFT_478192 [Ilyonectria robusta]KAH8694599.1 hypothetical protein BGZ61DRAFT_478192 [Ilyonectria robusta]
MDSLSEEDKLSHRERRSMLGFGETFSRPWVGDNPHLDDRRAYIMEYFRHMMSLTDFEPLLQRVRDNAERVVSTDFVAKGWTQVPIGIFEYQVNKAVWARFFAGFKDVPIWPWTSRTNLEAGPDEPYAVVFKGWREKILKEKESEKAAGTAELGSTGPKVTEIKKEPVKAFSQMSVAEKNAAYDAARERLGL